MTNDHVTADRLVTPKNGGGGLVREFPTPPQKNGRNIQVARIYIFNRWLPRFLKIYPPLFWLEGRLIFMNYEASSFLPMKPFVSFLSVEPDFSCRLIELQDLQEFGIRVFQ